MKFLMLLILMIFVSCSHVFYQPASDTYYTPEQFNLSYEDLYYPSKDGTNLNGWLIKADPKVKRKGLIVHFHGNAQNISSHFLNLAWIANEGFDIFIFDYRGYRNSKGRPDQKSVYEDAISSLNFGHGLFKKRKTDDKEKFIVFGQSLGGIISLRAMADFENQDKVDLLVMDSTFMSYQGIAFDKLSSIWFLYPFSPLAYLLVSDAYASDKTLDKVQRPTLVIVGEKDKTIPSKFGKKIYKYSRAPRRWIWKLEEGRHIDVFHINQGKYRSEFIKLIDSL